MSEKLTVAIHIPSTAIWLDMRSMISVISGDSSLECILTFPDDPADGGTDTAGIAAMPIEAWIFGDFSCHISVLLCPYDKEVLDLFAARSQALVYMPVYDMRGSDSAMTEYCWGIASGAGYKPEAAGGTRFFALPESCLKPYTPPLYNENTLPLFSNAFQTKRWILWHLDARELSRDKSLGFLPFLSAVRESGGAGVIIANPPGTAAAVSADTWNYLSDILSAIENEDWAAVVDTDNWQELVPACSGAFSGETEVTTVFRTLNKPILAPGGSDEELMRFIDDLINYDSGRYMDKDGITAMLNEMIEAFRLRRFTPQ